MMRAAELDQEAGEIRKDPTARANVGSGAMVAFIKETIAAEFRKVAEAAQLMGSGPTQALR